MILFEERIKENRFEFIKRVFEISDLLKAPEPDHLMFTMNFETNASKTGIIDHTIVNFQKGDDPDPDKRCFKRATGLIQFMPSTAINLGTTNYELRHMSNVEQLEYVYQYLKPYTGRYKSFVDLYLSVFYPKAIGKPDTFVITSDIIAEQNKVFDLNLDKDISKAEIKQVLFAHVPERFKHLFI